MIAIHLIVPKLGRTNLQLHFFCVKYWIFSIQIIERTICNDWVWKEIWITLDPLIICSVSEIRRFEFCILINIENWAIEYLTLVGDELVISSKPKAKRLVNDRNALDRRTVGNVRCCRYCIERYYALLVGRFFNMNIIEVVFKLYSVRQVKGKVCIRRETINRTNAFLTIRMN